MVAAIDMTRGAFIDQPAWWDGKKEKVVEMVPGMTLRDLAEIGNMDHRIEVVPAPNVILADGREVPVENQNHLVRFDRDGSNPKIIDASTVSDGYGEMNGDPIISALDAYVHAGYARPDAVFSIYDGREDIFQLRMLDASGPLGEDWALYFNVSSPHGGTGKLRGKVTGTRGVCANTVAMIYAAGLDWGVRHTKTVEKRFHDCMQDWKQAHDAINRFNAVAEKLARTNVDVPATVDALLKLGEKEKVSTQLSNKRDEIVRLANVASMGTEGRNLWDVFNAVTAYTSHDETGKGAQSGNERFVSMMGGTRGNFQQSAFKALTAMIPDGI